jgi:hypothetical protein
MTTALRTRHEILEERVEQGERHVRYRWTVTGGTTADGKPMADRSGIEWAMERVEPLAREVLQDRWNGLIGTDDYTKLGRQLNGVLFDLSDGLTRRETGKPDTVRVDGGVSIGLDTIMDIDGLIVVIHDWLIERAGKVAAA